MVAVVVDSSLEIERCPFCGSDDLHIETDTEPGSSYQVMCDNPDCEAIGPNGGQSADDAVRRWNQRTA